MHGPRMTVELIWNYGNGNSESRGEPEGESGGDRGGGEETNPFLEPTEAPGKRRSCSGV